MVVTAAAAATVTTATGSTFFKSAGNSTSIVGFDLDGEKPLDKAQKSNLAAWDWKSAKMPMS